MTPRKRDDPAASRRSESLPSAKARDAKISKSPRPASRSRPKRPPGRPFKMPSRSSSSQSRSGRSERPSASPSVAPIPSPTPPQRTLSLLEALPVEIIEQIFLYCLNLNLPRASRVLAAALSREHLYRLLILLAFFDDPPTPYPSSEAMEKVFAPLVYVPLTLQQRTELQEQVFRCKWLTMTRVQEEIPKMMNLTIHRQWINAGMTMSPRQQAELERFMARKDASVRVYYGKGPPLHSATRLSKDPEVQRLAKIPGPHDYEMHLRPNEVVEIRSVTMRSIVKWPALELITFPPHLLRGRSTGFTEDDVLFLEMLRMCSHNYKPVDTPLMSQTTTTVDRTALNEGITNAIRTQNLDALTTLLKIDEFTFRFHTPTPDIPPPSVYLIPADHFITVTKYGRDNPRRNIALFETLMRASAESLPASTREIAEWTLDMSHYIVQSGLRYPQINSRFVQWLADFAIRLPSQIGYTTLMQSCQLFCCGELDTGDSEGQRFITEVLKPERETLGNWTPESPYRPADYWLKKFGPELPPNFRRVVKRAPEESSAER